MSEPALLLADEPTGNLDSTSSADILDMLQELNREGRTIVLITHERDIADRAGRIIEIRDGEIWSPKGASKTNKKKDAKLVEAAT